MAEQTDDYQAKLAKIPLCAACGNKAIGLQACDTEGNVYCNACFKCSICGLLLGGVDGYYGKLSNNEPFECEACHTAKIKAKNDEVKVPANNDDNVDGNDDNNDNNEYNDDEYNANDDPKNKLSPDVYELCKVCGKQVGLSWVTDAKGNKYCGGKCFKCVKCGKIMDKLKYYGSMEDNNVTCEECFDQNNDD
mmetsp:Transcript_76872/g.94336  ORF Transcript_76872/g.94336 Transcript_76872/m.94336 type:complete len:192 (-) Transcript_76872:79-654(-)